MMNIKTLLANKNNYKSGRTSVIKYIVVHYTGNNGDTAKGNANYFTTDVGKSANYFVDDVDVYRSVGEENVAWHCGGSIIGTEGHTFYGKCTNNNSIGIELCSRKDSHGNFYFTENTMTNAADLIKYLMNKYNIPVSNVIRHFDVTGKSCPKPFLNDTNWKAFKNKLISQEVEELLTTTKIMLNGTEKQVNTIVKDGFNYIKIRDLADDKIIVDYDSVKKIPVIKIK